MTAENIEVCPVCKVKIKDDKEVIFSAGKPGDRSRLWARVCSYVTDKEGCINQDPDKISQIKPTDSYNPATFKPNQ